VIKWVVQNQVPCSSCHCLCCVAFVGDGGGDAEDGEDGDAGDGEEGMLGTGKKWKRGNLFGSAGLQSVCVTAVVHSVTAGFVACLCFVFPTCERVTGWGWSSYVGCAYSCSSATCTVFYPTPGAYLPLDPLLFI
jgi:hypothetical protein